MKDVHLENRKENKHKLGLLLQEASTNSPTSVEVFSSVFEAFLESSATLKIVQLVNRVVEDLAGDSFRLIVMKERERSRKKLFTFEYQYRVIISVRSDGSSL